MILLLRVRLHSLGTKYNSLMYQVAGPRLFPLSGLSFLSLKHLVGGITLPLLYGLEPIIQSIHINLFALDFNEFLF